MEARKLAIPNMPIGVKLGPAPAIPLANKPIGNIKANTARIEAIFLDLSESPNLAEDENENQVIHIKRHRVRMALT